MKEESFIKFWSKNYSNTAPIGHQLRRVFQDNWFRIHSLPKSKRYADSEEEYEIVLHRQNHLITNIIGEDEPMIMLIVRYNSSIEVEHYTSVIDFHKFQKIESTDHFEDIYQDADDEKSVDVFIKNTTWQSGRINTILKKIADDEIRMLFISISKNRIVAPYDGGVDVFLENEKVRDAFKLKYQKWLSKREDGL